MFPVGKGNGLSTLEGLHAAIAGVEPSALTGEFPNEAPDLFAVYLEVRRLFRRVEHLEELLCLRQQHARPRQSPPRHQTPQKMQSAPPRLRKPSQKKQSTPQKKKRKRRRHSRNS